MALCGISRKGVEIETRGAQIDAACITQERGKEIFLERRGESTVTYDKYNSVKRQNAVAREAIYSYPLETSPSTYLKEKAGIFQEVEIIAYVATYDMEQLGITSLEQIEELLSSVVIDDIKYNIKDKNEVSQFNGKYLYYTLGLYKK